MFGLCSRPSGPRNTDNYKCNDVGRRKQRTFWGPCSTRGRPRCLRHHVTLGPGEMLVDLWDLGCVSGLSDSYYDLSFPFAMCNGTYSITLTMWQFWICSQRRPHFFQASKKKMYSTKSVAHQKIRPTRKFFFWKPLAHALIAVSSSHYVLLLNSMKNSEVF